MDNCIIFILFRYTCSATIWSIALSEVLTALKTVLHFSLSISDCSKNSRNPIINDLDIVSRDSMGGMFFVYIAHYWYAENSQVFFCFVSNMQSWWRTIANIV